VVRAAALGRRKPDVGTAVGAVKAPSGTGFCAWLNPAVTVLGKSRFTIPDAASPSCGWK
jgi:hypothetical protein